MTPLPAASAVRTIEFFSQWIGFADPPSMSAKLTISNMDGRFVRQMMLAAACDEVPEISISRLLVALARPAIPKLDRTLFGVEAALHNNPPN